MKQIMPHHFEEIVKKGYSLDLIYLLSLIYEEQDVTDMIEDSSKIAILHQTLIRKDLLSEANIITVKGKELLDFIANEEISKLPKKAIKISEFEEWWKIFPSNNRFSHKGKSFAATRALKVKQEDCKKQFNKLVNDKKFTAREIIEATKIDVLLKKNESVKKGENKLTYLQNSLTYLNQCSFQGFIELIGSNDEEEKTIIDSGTDI